MTRAASPRRELTRSASLRTKCMAEACGTAIQVLMGMSIIASGITTGVQSGIWQTAVVWGFAITLTIYMTAQISGGHLCPAVTIACAVSHRHTGFKWKYVLPYIIAQVIGAALGAVLVFWIYHSAIMQYEERNGIVRGESANSTLSAMIFACYFPNPQLVQSGMMSPKSIGILQAIGIEVLLTAISIVIARGMMDKRNGSRPSDQQAPFYIGFSVACLICTGVPLTMGCMNPARDFGPRLIAWWSGWQSMAMPGPQYEMLVYWVGPSLGAVVGAIVYDLICVPALDATDLHMQKPVYRPSRSLDDPQPESLVLSLPKLQELLTQAAVYPLDRFHESTASAIVSPLAIRSPFAAYQHLHSPSVLRRPMENDTQHYA